MDWEAAVAKNREALKRIVLSLVAMAAVAGARTHLPRRLHRACLRLLRPAESATRRLIVVAARGLSVTLPPLRPRKVELANRPGFTLNRRGNPVPLPRRGPSRTKPVTRLSLPLFDTLPHLGPRRGRTVPPHRAPRVSGFDGALAPAFAAPGRVGTRRIVPPPPLPDDPIETARLVLRLEALASALDDLPRQALRFARWRSRAEARAAGPGPTRRVRRVSALRGGRPPGALRRPSHEVHEVLVELNGLAVWVQERKDTS